MVVVVAVGEGRWVLTLLIVTLYQSKYFHMQCALDSEILKSMSDINTGMFSFFKKNILVRPL